MLPAITDRSASRLVDAALRGDHPVKYRVIQWATGGVGCAAIQGIVNHPELDLVGCWVHSRSKEGRDAGELAGIAPLGVSATRDVDALLALDADCVSYTATGDLRPAEAIDDICRILEAGKNVVSTSSRSDQRTRSAQAPRKSRQRPTQRPRFGCRLYRFTLIRSNTASVPAGPTTSYIVGSTC
jgi:hypothetical protein